MAEQFKLKIYKLRAGQEQSIRFLPPKDGFAFTHFVDQNRFQFHSTRNVVCHPDRPVIGECFMCDHEKDSRYTQFRDKMMGEAETEI